MHHSCERDNSTQQPLRFATGESSSLHTEQNLHSVDVFGLVRNSFDQNPLATDRSTQLQQFRATAQKQMMQGSEIRCFADGPSNLSQNSLFSEERIISKILEN